jgi:hypothetical protein
MSTPMLTPHSATVLPFRASARRSPTHDSANLEQENARAATSDNVVLMRDNVIALAGWRTRRPGPFAPGGAA